MQSENLDATKQLRNQGERLMLSDDEIFGLKEQLEENKKLEKKLR